MSTASGRLGGMSMQIGMAVDGAPVIHTKSDMAYWHLRQEILDGTLAPGELIDQEAVAARLGLSTTPVREAIRRLQSERLVVSRAHREVCVSELSPKLLSETYAIRLALDPLAASEAARHATDEQIAAIKSLAEAKPSQDAVEMLHRNRAFHRAIYTACGNGELIDILEMLWDRTDRYRLITIAEGRLDESASRMHVAIAEAIAERDAKKASALMKDLLRASMKSIERSPRLTEAAISKKE